MSMKKQVWELVCDCGFGVQGNKIGSWEVRGCQEWCDKGSGFGVFGIRGRNLIQLE